MFAASQEALPSIQSGLSRAIAITSAQRIALLPDVPPVADTIPGFESVFWQGLFAPAGLPVEIVARIEAAKRPVRLDAVLLMAEHDHDAGGTQREGDADGIVHQRTTRDRVEHLDGAGPHAGAQTCGHDHKGSRAARGRRVGHAWGPVFFLVQFRAGRAGRQSVTGRWGGCQSPDRLRLDSRGLTGDIPGNRALGPV